VAKQILAEEGLLGGRSPHGGGGLLFKAITASMARNGCFNMVYFGFYHSVKDIVPKAEVIFLLNEIINIQKRKKINKE
jgi:solute carrier family 25 2-oxodicarboxylate transporter 21